MGEVYLAQDLTLDRKAALKFLPEGQTADPIARQRLIREANAAARLDHPFITKVYDAGSADEHPFIAMELVEGQTLKDRLARGPMPLAETLKIGSEIAEALEFARQRGIVHRDLKPANVMLTADGHVKVMDFGIAKSVAAASDQSGGDGPSLTASGVITGTPAYMAPEQLRGQAVDSRADIFALGVCLYEMITGTHPFLKESTFGTADAILNQPPPPVEQFMKEPNELLDHVLGRALAKNPDDRYQTFRDLRRDLDAMSQRRTGSTVAVPAKKGWRTRLPVAAAVAGVLLIGTALVWYVRPFRISISQQALAFNERDWILITDFVNLTGDPMFDRSLKVALDVAIAQSQYVNVFPQSRLPEVLRMMKQKPPDGLDEALALEIAQRARIKAVLACSITTVGEQYSLTARLIDPQTHAAVLTESANARGKDGVLPALDELATKVRRNLGESLASVTEQKVPLPLATTASLEALRLYADSLRPQPDGVDIDLLTQAVKLDPDFALAHAQLGRTLYESPARASRKAGEEHFVKALSLLGRLSQRERLWITAIAEDARGNRDAAIAQYRTYAAQYPDDQSAWFRLGWTYLAGTHQYEEAIKAFTRTIELNPSNANAHVNLATAYSGLGKTRESIDRYRQAFSLDSSLITDVIINHEYGFTLVEAGDLDGAAETFARMLSLNNKGLEARGHRSLALLEMYRGRYGAAIGHLQQSIPIHKTNTATLSEFRDRLFLAVAHGAKGMKPPMAAELETIERLARTIVLNPEWLRRLAKVEARAGRLRQARDTLALMSKTAGDTTASSALNSNAGAEQAHFDLVRGEIAMAEGHAARAVELFDAAAVLDTRTDSIESLARGLTQADRLADAAKRYEEILKAASLGNEEQQQWLETQVRLADISARLGQTDRARQLLEGVVARWKGADEDLQLLKDARQQLARLNASRH